MKQVLINGRQEWTDAVTIAGLVEQYGLGAKRIVVELNGVILAREAWLHTSVDEGAKLELVHFVGGG
nr:sulfur carrier protein ThiS [Paenibacillus phyllosphaerae]